MRTLRRLIRFLRMHRARRVARQQQYIADAPLEVITHTINLKSRADAADNELLRDALTSIAQNYLTSNRRYFREDK